MRRSSSAKKKKTTIRTDSQSGSVNQMREMRDRSTKYQPSRKYIKNDSDALFDMIDQRIGNLLLRSSELESKLDVIEKNARKTSAPLYASAISKSMKSNETQQYNNNNKINESIIATPKIVPTTYKITDASTIENPTPDLSSLFKIVELLTQEVKEMKLQQRKMSEHINSIHHQIIHQQSKSNDE